MFKIDKLIMRSKQGEEYIYEFDYGINYFKGKNNSGKTEFYKFIDYMLGSSEKISKQYWYKDTLKEATIELCYNNISYVLTRSLNAEINYFHYKDEEKGEPIGSIEYKDKLNSIFGKDNSILKNIREFTEENLTYRTFTMFNFLGEKRQGVLNDFLDKCSDIKYSIKLNSILNFIFNKNLSLIFNLKKELEKLQDEVKSIERVASRFDFLCNKVNLNLCKLNIAIQYNGINSQKIRNEIESIKSMEGKSSKGGNKTIAELEVIYNNLDEQIKIYENRILDSKKMSLECENRKILLNKLKDILNNTNELIYLIEPITNLVGDLESNISFSKYIINDATIKEMKKQRENIRQEILSNDCRFKRFDIDDKTKAISIIEDYLNEDISYNEGELKEKRKRIKNIKEEIKILQNADDVEKIEEISNNITNLYKAAYEVSELVKHDVDIEGFKIQYLKKGNILQPMIRSNENDANIVDIKERKLEKYYTGSMARHTLIQLSAYLSFLELLTKEEKYPIVPILVIDHISKPFDLMNRRAIGTILEKFYETVDKKDIQIFMFDDESNEDLLVTKALVNNLISDNKSGFNPFYYEVRDDYI
ncbi:hypothetical protein [Clostridium botulinum]|uniref:hypothetical protein n=1 Tax=Clostridium botulinum TaxID=1491 RepID=UPI0018FED82B|nr:hypothetical protein [Clostridium botulinum]